jgi:hypothetical protein
MDNFYVGAYWGPRKESALDCAKRLSNCLSQLGVAHPTLASWHPKGASRAAASGASVSVVPEDLAQLLARGRNRRDVDGSVIEELGFSAGLWNRKSVAVAFSVTCGSYLSIGSIMNSFVIQLPAPEAEALELYEPRIAQAITYSLVDSWDPEWATWASFSMREVQGQSSAPIFGWLTYLGAQLASNASVDTVLPPGADLTNRSTGIVIKASENVMEASGERVLEVREKVLG